MGKLTEQTWIPLGMAAGLVVAGCVASYQVAGALNTMSRSVEDLRKDVKECWTVSDMKDWTYEARDKNPSIAYPNPASIHTANGTQ